MRTAYLPPTAKRSPTALASNVLLVGSALLLAGLVAYWGGVTRSQTLFLVGLLILLTMILTAGVVAWWLFASPLPTDAPITVLPRATELRQLVAVLAVISGTLLLAGAFWDELWHRRYGVGAVINDFFWRPHIMIYGSMAINSLFALGALLLVLRGRGDIRRGIRAEPLIGLLGVASAYLALSGPSDLFWHQIYGVDISAWSLPHLMLAGSASLVMLITVGLLLSLLPQRPWGGLGGLTIYEGLAILVLALGTMFVGVILTSEWEGLTRLGGSTGLTRELSRAFYTRPVWVYPVVVVTLAVLVSSIALHALRRAGVATLVMLTLLALRLVLFTAFGVWTSGLRMGFVTQLLMLPPALALDIWYARRLPQAEHGTTLLGGGLIAGVAFLAIALPTIPIFLEHPPVDATTIPPMIVFSLLLALWSTWSGARLGTWIGQLDRRVAAPVPVRPPMLRVGLGALIALIAFTIFFVVTATPPV